MAEFENIFVYKAYGIVKGVGKEMQIRQQQEYEPLTYDNTKRFLKSALTTYRNEIVKVAEKLKRTDDTQMNDDHVWDEALDTLITTLQE